MKNAGWYLRPLFAAEAVALAVATKGRAAVARAQFGSTPAGPAPSRLLSGQGREAGALGAFRCDHDAPCAGTESGGSDCTQAAPYASSPPPWSRAGCICANLPTSLPAHFDFAQETAGACAAPSAPDYGASQPTRQVGSADLYLVPYLCHLCGYLYRVCTHGNTFL